MDAGTGKINGAGAPSLSTALPDKSGYPSNGKTEASDGEAPNGDFDSFASSGGDCRITVRMRNVRLGTL